MACNTFPKTNETGLRFVVEECFGLPGTWAPATMLVTFAGQPANGETITLQNKTYTFQTALTNVDGNVLIGGTLTASISNLFSAITLGAGSGTTYAALTTANLFMTATLPTATTLTLQALLTGARGNDLVVSETIANVTLVGNVLTLGTGGTWKVLEPNSIGKLTPAITTVARDPISPTRQQRKGTIVNLESGAEFEADMGYAPAQDFLRGFMFAEFKGVPDKVSYNVTSTGIRIAPLTATQAGFVQYSGPGAKSLFYVSNFTTVVNNGLKVIGGAVTASTTDLLFAGLAVETSISGGTVEIAGIRAPFGDLSMARTTVSPTYSTLTITSAGQTVFNTLGLELGQFVHIGGLVIANQFAGGKGYGRIIAITASSITLDRIKETGSNAPGALMTFTTPDNGAGKTIDILFGKYIKNVATDDPSYLEQFYAIEMTHKNLGGAGIDNYVYSLGNACDEMTINIPGQNKSTVGFKFKGSDTEPETATRRAGAANSLPATRVEAFNTSSDVIRLIVEAADGTGLTTDFEDATLTLANGADYVNVIGRLGAKYAAFGNFKVNLKGKVVFTSPGVLAAIRANTTCGMYMALRNNEGAMFMDIPTMTLGDGSKEFTKDKNISINLDCTAFGDSAGFNTSLSWSFIPTTPI